MFRKSFFKLFILFFISFLIFPKPSYGQQQFRIDADVEYRVQKTGITKVTHDITLTNLYSNLYATTYQLDLENIDPKNAKAFENNNSLNITTTKDNDITTLGISFDDAMAGKGKSRSFKIMFEVDNLAVRTGEVWEISIPKLSNKNAFSDYKLVLLVPNSFGKEAYLSPETTNKTEENGFLKYEFSKSEVANFGVSAGFGKFQVFSFTINYHLENPLAKEAQTEVALPPDTSFQKMYYESIEPAPQEIKLDEDGNWIAIYLLRPRQRVDIVALGNVQIYSSPRKTISLSDQEFDMYLEPKEFWESDDPFILDLGQRLKTPRAIYNFVVANLKYDYDRVRPNVERLGALASLDNTEIAICMEFTDLFIAIARAAGIPAREINGFAYTENPEIQPLSLVADVLHSWPEYWDRERSSWIPVDPTWGSTTGGVNFFDKLDLRHFTFVIHGNNSTLPYPPGSYKLGPNPQKDVFVNFGQLPIERTSKPEITAYIKKGLFFTNSKLEITIYNPGPSALYEVDPTVYFENEIAEKFYIDALLPYSSKNFQTTIPFSFLGSKTPEKITISVEGSLLELPSNKTQVITYNLLIIFGFISFIALIIVFRIKREKIKNTLNELKTKIKNRKSEKIQNNESDTKT